MENKKPSVTELLKLLDKPALLSWANKQGLQGYDITKEKSKWLFDGLSLHTQIERFHKDGVAFDDNVTQDNYLTYIQDKEVLMLEEKIETEYFQGRIDSLIKWKGKVYLIDYKKKTIGKTVKLYLENKLQLVAYGMAVECDSFAIVSVPEFKVYEANITDRKPYEEIIKSLSNIYKQKQLI